MRKHPCSCHVGSLATTCPSTLSTPASQPMLPRTLTPSLPLQMAAQLAAFPLAVAGMRVQASQLHAPGGIALIGDAAHGVTPRTGAATFGWMAGMHA